jgi:YggT family protein
MVIYTAINILLNFVQMVIFSRIIISWLPIPKDNPIIRLIYQITEPILAPIRGMIERSAFGKNMMIDFSPIIVFLLIGFVRSIIRTMS